MGGGSGEKKHLGKIALQQRFVSPDELQERREGARAMAPRKRSAIDEALAALSDKHGMPSSDPGREVIPLAALRLIPRELAEERQVLPLRVEGESLLLAMGAPEDDEVVEDLEFVAGKKIVRFVALGPALEHAIAYAYERLELGDEYYVGARVTEAELAERGLPDLKRAPEPKVELPEPAVEAKSGGAPGEAPPQTSNNSAKGAANETENGEHPQRAEAAEADSAEAESLALGGTPAPGLDEAFAHRTEPSQPPVMPKHDANARVLVAGVDAALSLRDTLRETGIAVYEASDGENALELARDHAPRVVVLEPDLPGIHGFEICRHLRANEQHRAVPIIVVSPRDGGWRLTQDLKDVYGVQHVFHPPVDLMKLTQVVRLVLEGQTVNDDPDPLPPEAEAHWNAGMDAFERGDFDSAIAALEEGVKSHADAFELQLHLGLLYGRREQWFAAIKALEHAVSLQPSHFSALKNLAVLYQRTGFRHQAIDVWERALGVAPNDDTRRTIRDHMVGLLS